MPRTMPAVFLDRLPLPSLQAYTVGSVVLLACSVHYAIQVTSQLGARSNSTEKSIAGDGYVPYHSGIRHNVSFNDFVLERVVIRRAVEILYFMLQEPMCIWTIINMAYCCFILVGKIIQKLVFGDLRVSEQQHIKDKFWNFVFYKFIFIFGVMNVQFMDEVVLWCSWFSILGFLHLLAQLCKDRCEYLSFSPSTPGWTHCRVLTLLFGILLTSCGLFGLSSFVGIHAGINTFSFMAAECSLVCVRTIYVIVRYALYLLDTKYEGAWEKRASYMYYTELGFELAALIIDFVHHLHMLLWGNMFPSMASLVITMQLRCLFYEIKHRLKKYRNYLRIVRHMEHNYPMATPEELEKNNDDCAICWDHLDSARKLPCCHLFHNACLRSWLEQDISCPTCRKLLTDKIERDIIPDMNNIDILNEDQSQSNGHSRNQFFHFDGSQYVSWLPSFFVEVSHPNISGEREITSDETSQLDNMAHQVQHMFPHVPLSTILDDLRISKSVERTIDSILDGKLVMMPSLFQGNQNLSLQEPSIQALESNHSVLGKQTLVACNNQADYNEDEVFHPDNYDVEELDRFPGLTCMQIASPLGCRFSKSPQERERMLAKRKVDLIKVARRRYLEKFQQSEDESSS